MSLPRRFFCWPLLAIATSSKSRAEITLPLRSIDDWNPVPPMQGRMTAVVFFSPECGVSNKYLNRFRQLSRMQDGRLQVVFVAPNTHESDEVIRKFAFDQFKAGAYRDAGLVDLVQASFTPSVALLDEAGKVAYRGSFDDSPNPARVTKTYLVDAMDALRQGKLPIITVTKAFGCTIKR
jgi:hypothetical protein